MMIHARAYPRAGLIGNPSDGYFGKTIAFTFTNFHAEIVLYESPELEILPDKRDHSRFTDMAHLAEDVKRFGYYGGIRLLKAAIKRFYEYTVESGTVIDNRNFHIRYTSNIPHLVGLAGSSAIITACFRAMMMFYGVRIPKPELANLVLSVETDELGISAGLQDRVAQVYQGVVYMDFDEALMKSRQYGEYEWLDASSLPPLYIAYRTDLSEGSEVFHGDFRERYRRRDPQVLAAIESWKGLTEQAREAILDHKPAAIGPLLDANFDLRAEVSEISEGNRAMVAAARSCGASAKFTGSGGAIVGTYDDPAMYARLEETFGAMGIEILQPALCEPLEEQGDDS